jgi:hypothetical protein
MGSLDNAAAAAVAAVKTDYYLSNNDTAVAGLTVKMGYYYY